MSEEPKKQNDRIRQPPGGASTKLWWKHGVNLDITVTAYDHDCLLQSVSTACV